MGQGLLVRRGGGGTNLSLQSINILSNGRYQASDYSVAGWNDIEVSVPMSFTSIDLSVSSNGSYAPSDYSVDAFGNVTVDVQYATSALNVSVNGVYNPSNYGVQGFSEVTVNVPQEGVNYETSILNGEITSYTNNDVSYLRSLAFNQCIYLSSAVFPNVTATGIAVFSNCTRLTYISLPKLQLLQASTFLYAASLPSFIGPEVVSIGTQAFFNCTLLSFVSVPKCNFIQSYVFPTRLESIITSKYVSEIGSYAFQNTYISEFKGEVRGAIRNNAFERCLSLIDINVNVCSSIGGYAFSGCMSLFYSLNSGIFNTRANYIGTRAFSSCWEISYLAIIHSCTLVSYAFYSCRKMSYAFIPGVSSLQSQIFQYCSALEQVVVAAGGSISNYVFESTNIRSLYIFSTIGFTYSLKTIGVVSSAFGVHNPFFDTTNSYYSDAKIYVQDNWVSSYKAATNWVAVSSRFESMYRFSVSGEGVNYFDHFYLSGMTFSQLADNPCLKYNRNFVLNGNNTTNLNVASQLGYFYISGNSVYIRRNANEVYALENIVPTDIINNTVRYSCTVISEPLSY